MDEQDEAYLLSDQQGRTLQRHRHHLVWVPCHRVGSEVNKKKITSDPLDLHKLLTLSPVCVPHPQKYHLPVNSVQLPPVSPGHEEASSPRTLTGNSVIFQMSQKMKLIVIFIIIFS